MPNFYHSSDFLVGLGYDAVMLNPKNTLPLFSKLREHFVLLRRVAANRTFNPEPDPISIAAVNTT